MRAASDGRRVRQARADEDMTSVGWCLLCAPGGERFSMSGERSQASAVGSCSAYGCATGYIMLFELFR